MNRIALAACLLLLGGSRELVAQAVGEVAFRARGGASYFQDFADSQGGGLYGLDMAAPVAERVSLFGSFTHNHFGKGGQYLGTLGGFRQGAATGHWSDRVAGGVLLDQYTDTRFDGLYLSQFRYFAGLTLSENLAAGVTYTHPLSDDDDVALAALGPGATTLRNAEVIEGYCSLNVGATTITAALGQRLSPSDFVASLHARRQIGPRLSLFSNASYTENRLWAATMGLAWSFGPGSCAGGGHATAGRSADGASTSAALQRAIVRAQTPWAVRSPFADASLGHNLNYDAQRLGSMITATAGDGLTTDALAPTSTGGANGSEGAGGEEDIFRIELDFTSPP